MAPLHRPVHVSPTSLIHQLHYLVHSCHIEPFSSRINDLQAYALALQPNYYHVADAIAQVSCLRSRLRSARCLLPSALIVHCRAACCACSLTHAHRLCSSSILPLQSLFYLLHVVGERVGRRRADANANNQRRCHRAATIDGRGCGPLELWDARVSTYL